MKTPQQPAPPPPAGPDPDSGNGSDPGHGPDAVGSGTGPGSDVRAANSHAQVLDALERYERPLIRYTARVLSGDIERARDVTQEAFLRLCREPVKESETHLAAWLFRVARNLALDVRRKEKRMETMSMESMSGGTLGSTRPDDAKGPAQHAELRDESSRVATAIQSLPGSQAEILQLRFQQGMSYRELAEVTGRSVSAVGVLMHKGVQTLRRRLASSELGIPMPAPLPAVASLSTPPRTHTSTKRIPR